MCLITWKNFSEIRTVLRMAQSGFGARFPQRDTTATRLLAANVRRLRLVKGWTQDDLAATLEVEQQAISLIENGRANPTVTMLDAFAEALGVHVAELFKPSTTRVAPAAKGRISR